MVSLQRDLTRFSEYPIKRYVSDDHFLDEPAVPGISSIRFGEGTLDMLFVDRGADTTVVVFHAAVPGSVSTVPVFSGLGLTAPHDVNLLAISDPGLVQDLRLAWFTGTRAKRLQHTLPRMIDHYRLTTDIGENLVLFGASGGGFASIHYSCLLPGSLGIAINPQTNIGNYYKNAVGAYVRSAWGVDSIEGVRAMTDLREMPVTSGATIAYIQNSTDAHHIERHMLPWVDGLGDGRQRVWSLMDDWGPGHQPPPYALLSELIRMASEAGGRWDEALNAHGFEHAPTSASVTARARL